MRALGKGGRNICTIYNGYISGQITGVSSSVAC